MPETKPDIEYDNSFYDEPSNVEFNEKNIKNNQ